MSSEFFTTNAAFRPLIQEGLLERMILDALFPKLLFRTLFDPQEWTDTAQQKVKTRRGLLAPNMARLAPKTDPTPQSYNMEQWNANILHYGDSVDTDLVVSGLALSDLVISDSKVCGMQGGQSISRLARNEAYNACTSGQTVTTTVGNGVAKAVPFINGFTRAYSTTSKKFEPVSVANPLAAAFWNAGGGVWDVVSITGCTPTTPGDEYGPGTLTLLAAYNSINRQPLCAYTASYIVRSGGGYSVDALASTDLFTLATIRSAVAQFRTLNVAPRQDGFYACHLDPISEAQLYADTEFQRLFTHRGLDRDENEAYAMFYIGNILGCKLFRNNECPTATTVPAAYGTDGGNFASEMTNATGVPIHRVIFAGEGFGEENWKEAIGPSEAGVTGKIGNWSLTNTGIMVTTDRIQMIMRAPVDRLQRLVSTTWSFMGSHIVAPDYLATGKAFETLASGSSAFKRGIVVEHGAA